MKNLLLVTGFLFLYYCSAAQQESIRVKAGEDIAQAFSTNGFYRFPEFRNTTFKLKDGKIAAAKANYNFLYSEIQYINSKGDTMALDGPENMENISIGDVHFIYDKFYMEIVQDADSLKLAKRVVVRINTEKKGGYGESAPAASIDNMRNLFTSSGVYNLSLSYDVTITKTNTFFWLDQKNNASLATQKNIIKMLTSPGKPLVEEYIKQNKIEFNKEESLTLLLQYAAPYAKAGK